MNILLLFLLLLLYSCGNNPIKHETTGPFFKPGEYGGDAMSGTEWITAVYPSPDGKKIALDRYWTPGRVPDDPKDQLWIVNKDGSDPELIATGSAGVSWSPDGTKISFTYLIFPDTYVFVVDLNTMKATQLNGGKGTVF